MVGKGPRMNETGRHHVEAAWNSKQFRIKIDGLVCSDMQCEAFCGFPSSPRTCISFLPMFLGCCSGTHVSWLLLGWYSCTPAAPWVEQGLGLPSSRHAHCRETFSYRDSGRSKKNLRAMYIKILTT